MNTSWTMIGVALLVTCAVGSAEARGPRGPGFHPGRIEALAAEVGVDDATLAKIKELAFKAEQEAIALRAELQRAELELRRLIDQDKPDTGLVMKQVEQVGQAETRLRKSHVQLLLNVRALLTAEQRQRLEALVGSRRGLRGLDGVPPGGGLGGGGIGPGPGPGAGPGPGRRGGGLGPGVGGKPFGPRGRL